MKYFENSFYLYTMRVWMCVSYTMCENLKKSENFGFGVRDAMFFSERAQVEWSIKYGEEDDVN